MAASVDVEPCKQRSCARQKHRSNVETESAEKWFRINAAIPFPDDIMTKLDERFSILVQTRDRPGAEFGRGRAEILFAGTEAGAGVRVDGK